MTDMLAAKAELLRSLHVPGHPLLLPNAWDTASARAIEGAGFPIVATGSQAVAESLGFEGGEAGPADAMLAAVARIAGAVGVPVTADLEAGYRLDAAELIERLLATGAVGCNLEDTDHRHGSGLVDATAQSNWIAAVRRAADAAAVPVVVNARVDVFLRGVGEPERQLADAIARGRRYRDAGADCVYPIWVVDEVAIAALVEGIGGPINIYARPEAPSNARLAELGVARVSYGPWIHQLAMREANRALAAIRDGSDPYGR